MNCKVLRLIAFALLGVQLLHHTVGFVAPASAQAMHNSDAGDPALSVSSTPSGNIMPPKGDPALSVSSNPTHVIPKGDPALSVSSAPGTLNPALCKDLIKHTPDANVTYQPGVDARGNAVAPADIAGAAPIEMPKTYTIPITIGLASALNLNTTQYPYNQLGEGTETQLGVLTVTGDHALFNGKPISDEQQDNLAVLCMKANK